VRRPPSLFGISAGITAPPATVASHPWRQPFPGRAAATVVALSAVLALVAGTLAITGAVTGSSPTASTGSALTRPAPSPTAADLSLASAATEAYRTAVEDDGSHLVADVQQLTADVGRGDLAAARTDELRAQGDFDRIRFVDAASPQNAAAVDALVGQVLPGDTVGGLHGVEQDLWAGGDAAPVLPSLDVQATVAARLVGRERLSPAVVAEVAVQQLDWVVDQALTGREEQFSHLDLVDVAAGVGAASQAFAAIRPLSCAVDRRECATAATDLQRLTADVAALGAPVELTDAGLGVGVTSRLSREANRTADALASLEPPLVPFGTTGPEPYGVTTGL
jgi:iron uptake system component EfeO